ncbi:hypothetical protein HYN69_14245 [Gemmobacter aquarius]|uniref:Amine oxidase domain-containing protein n=1 Tax=Paragemmobacter aquarius TaxID=2169400 RepID=A0A2S0UNW6_9RHOB|nr:NAD(P)/FAD-dependent oxidoreductase [Gemmobacter aquarius]AWB49503.1 hypothetical protein HYN69_14245 [Gemmobacter aquarius]
MTTPTQGRTAVIIGAGPAGLTAAHEFVTRSGIKPVLIEADTQVGGISRTVNYKGNRIDIGGHRFFSKSDRVMDWWANVLPLQSMHEDASSLTISYQNKHRSIDNPTGGADPALTDDVMLVRPRVSRILYLRQFFDYPIKFSLATLAGLGLWRSTKIFFSYARARILPIRPERSLRDFIINRFGAELYATFFRDYTEKVWGVPCEDIPAEWGAQRIKGLSITALLKNALRKLKPQSATISQRNVETSLIERFLYPKHGPGQLWEKVASGVTAKGGELHMQTRVTAVHHDGSRVTAIDVTDASGEQRTITGDYFFSTMPVRDLLQGLIPPAPAAVQAVSDGLTYRDFITVGVLLKRIKLNGGATAANLYDRVPDNWIYVQEPDVKVGRIQIFNNWSPYLVANPDDIWIGLEYFVNEGDDIWSMPDADLTRFAVEELAKLGVSDPDDVKDAVVVRTLKAYPAYFGSYDRFDEVRDYMNRFENLFLVGRNGMHRYNNQDHSMLTAMVAVDGILEGRDTHAELWEINTEQEYHEAKKD